MDVKKFQQLFDQIAGDKVVRRAGLGARAVVQLEHRGAIGDDQRTHVQLVGPGHGRERLQRDRDQRRMSNPRAIVPVARLPRLVGPDLLEGELGRKSRVLCEVHAGDVLTAVGERTAGDLGPGVVCPSLSGPDRAR